LLGFPIAESGQRIGLLGGSFDPAHAGHVHITLQAMRRFGLDRVWWLVSPQNPLKSEGPAAMSRRLVAARAIMQHPRVTITDLEDKLGTRFTADTLARITAIYPRARFVWLMGADNLAGFHHWQDWEEIMATMPLGITSRPDEYLRAAGSVVAQKYASARLPSRASRVMPLLKPPVWCLLDGPVVHASSSEIRARGDW